MNINDDFNAWIYILKLVVALQEVFPQDLHECQIDNLMIWHHQLITAPNFDVNCPSNEIKLDY